jgi:hypothetical protein
MVASVLAELIEDPLPAQGIDEPILADAGRLVFQELLPAVAMDALWRRDWAGRTVDAADLSRLLGLATDEQIDEARAFLQAHASTTDLEVFESLVRLGRLEFGDESER